MLDWLAGWWQDSTDYLGSLFGQLQTFLTDMVLVIFRTAGEFFLYVLNSIQLPTALTNTMQSLLNQLDPGIAYVLAQSKFIEAMAIIGAGVVFLLLRKVVTLGQW